MRLISYQDAATTLGLQLSTLYAMVSRKQIPHVHLGPRLVRFDADELAEWVRARHVAAQATGETAILATCDAE